MKELHLIGLAIFAVLASGAITASTALAESEWLWEKEPISVQLTFEWTNEATYIDDSTGMKYLCSWVFVGPAGPGKVGKITEIASLSLFKEATTNLAGQKVNALSCTLVEKGLCTEANGSLIWAIPVNLPWATEIVLDEGIFVDRLPANAGYEISCNTFIGVQTDVCTGAMGADLTNAVEGVVSEFLANDELTNPAGNCTVGGANTWLPFSDAPGLIFHITGGTLGVS
jgi:hypothetical protein